MGKETSTFILVDRHTSDGSFSGIEIGPIKTFWARPKPWKAWLCIDSPVSVDITTRYEEGFMVRSRSEGLQLVNARGIEIPQAIGEELANIIEDRLEFESKDIGGISLPIWIASEPCSTNTVGLKVRFSPDRFSISEMPNLKAHRTRVDAAIQRVAERFPVPVTSLGKFSPINQPKREER